MKVVASILSFVLMLCPSLSLADECVGMVLTPRIVVDSGESLIAMPPSQAACLAKRAEQARELVSLVEEQDTLIRLQEHQIRTTTTALAAAKSLASLHEARGNDALDLAKAQSDELIRLNSWTRSPALWAGIGASVTVVAVVLLRSLVR